MGRLMEHKWSDHKVNWKICGETFSGYIDEKQIDITKLFSDKYFDILYVKFEDGKVATLFDSYITHYSTSIKPSEPKLKVVIKELSPLFMIVGGEFEKEDLKFDRLESTLDISPVPEIRTIKAPFNDCKILFSISPNPISHHSSGGIKKTISIKLTPPKPVNLEKCTGIIRKFQGLLSVVFNTPFYTCKFRGEVNGKKVKVYGGFPEPLEEIDRKRIIIGREFLTEDKIESVISEACKSWKKLEIPLSFYCDASFFTRPNVKTLLFLYVSGFEGWHKSYWHEEFTEKQIKRSPPIKLIERLENLYKDVNFDKAEEPVPKIIPEVCKEIFNQYKENFKKILDLREDNNYKKFLKEFFKRVKDTRNTIAHGGIKQGSPFENLEEFIIATDLMRLIFRFCLLRSMGLEDEELAELLLKEYYDSKELREVEEKAEKIIKEGNGSLREIKILIQILKKRKKEEIPLKNAPDLSYNYSKLEKYKKLIQELEKIKEKLEISNTSIGM